MALHEHGEGADVVEVGVGNDDGVDRVVFEKLEMGDRLDALVFRMHAGVENDSRVRRLEQVRVGADSGVAAEALENHEVGRGARATLVAAGGAVNPAASVGLTGGAGGVACAAVNPPHQETIRLAVVGGGPAGLRAAEAAASRGVAVTVFDGKPSVGRKFLVAGKSGLNLTHGEPQETFVSRYTGDRMPQGMWEKLLRDFDAAAMRAWAKGLGIDTFEASSGRIYPVEMKAAPLLRRWIHRLKDLGVRFEMNHRWTGIEPGAPHRLLFSDGSSVSADAVVLALGGGSWPSTGSDGAWVPLLRAAGVKCSPLAPANCGWEHPWPDEVLAAAEGKPLKNLHVRAGGVEVAGELMVTRYGLEGGAIYQLGAVLRSMETPAITIDFKPTFTVERLVAKMQGVRRGFLDEARVRWKLSDAARALLGGREWDDVEELAREVKKHVVRLGLPRPLEEAISSAGGVAWDELDGNLMIRRMPGVFVAGEMIDWEAPTGGYLMQGCFATGQRAGNAAADRLC